LAVSGTPGTLDGMSRQDRGEEATPSEPDSRLHRPEEFGPQLTPVFGADPD
jgi:hypothetical protein